MAELHREVGELVAARLDLSYPDALAAVALGVLGGFAPY
jgi:hypothetical protein